MLYDGCSNRLSVSMSQRLINVCVPIHTLLNIAISLLFANSSFTLSIPLSEEMCIGLGTDLLGKQTDAAVVAPIAAINHRLHLERFLLYHS